MLGISNRKETVEETLDKLSKAFANANSDDRNFFMYLLVKHVSAATIKKALKTLMKRGK